MHASHNARSVAQHLQPAVPVTLVRPHAAASAGRFFANRFPGQSFYAVKANPAPELLQVLWAAGIHQFDVASIAEVRLVHGLFPGATLAFMHPVKAEEAIAEAYHQFGVRIFSLDSVEELAKIRRACTTGGVAADDLTLCVRLKVSSGHSKLSLAGKFGVAGDEAAQLLFAARRVAQRLGVCFHVGSQAMAPSAYTEAMAIAGAAIVEAGVTIDIVDVGGGFPSRYPGMEPPRLERYFAAIAQGFEDLPVSYSAELWCEPGRALAADYASVLVRVEKRRGQDLYINDGAYGSLFDAAHVGWRYPARHVRLGDDGGQPAPLADFAFYGPTCDDLDHMRGPFRLPADITAGDYIEIGQLGAYGQAMRTAFNGFGDGATVVVADAPMRSSIPAEEWQWLDAGHVSGIAASS